MKEGHGKNKGKKDKMKKLKPIKDKLDDNKREQITPVEEPPAEEQDERWAMRPGDPRTPVHTPREKEGDE
jgi:hypothetical protein